MNIESLADCISEFRIRVVNSGFKRDVNDYVQSLPQNGNNIIALREVAEKLRNSLLVIYGSDLPESLKRLFPTPKVRPFTEKDRLAEVTVLTENKTITLAEFHNKLTQTIQQLQTDLQQNEAEITKIEAFIGSYVEKDIKGLTDAHEALLSIIFKDTKTITSLKELTKTLLAWNRVLPIYHQLLKSESPKDIRLVEVQNGSVDFIVNLNVDVAVHFAEIFATGFKCYAAYLLYKKLLKPITDTYYGNRKLIDGEEGRDRELLNNIGEAIRNQIKEQHENAKESGVKPVAAEKMIEQVENLVTAHIVRGNDIKLLASPGAKDPKAALKKEGLREASVEAANARNALPPADVLKLLEKYGDIKGD